MRLHAEVIMEVPGFDCLHFSVGWGGGEGENESKRLAAIS